ncbi:hypothetical protein HWV62_19469 [Athelia sp. TMB]|nr:hypothetical protein HWV62_19469 [Athelia sp. TMB]
MFLNIDMYDAYTGKSIMAERGIAFTAGAFIRVNRAKFRKLLLTDLPVKWNHKFLHYEIMDTGDVRAFFEGGITSTGSVLVGADGLRSRVRNTMYQSNPPALNIVPTGIIVGEVTLNREQWERQAKLARSFHVCIAKGFLLFTGLKAYSDDLSEGNFYWLYFFPEQKPATSWIKTASKEELLAFTKEAIKDIRPEFREIVELQTPERMGQPFVMYDHVPEMCPAGPVTLIGDAIHPMTPLRGEGANNAMRDSIELGWKLGEAMRAGSSLPHALRAYEADMVPRATTSVIGSREAALLLEQ